MWCPHHFKNATVEMARESFDDFSMQVITCCDEFPRCVEETLDTLVTPPGGALSYIQPHTS
jgi:hypothetical protein